MWNHVEIMFLHGFDISCTFWSCEGLPVMCEGLPVICHDCNHDSHTIAMTSQCECDDITHMMQTQ